MNIKTLILSTAISGFILSSCQQQAETPKTQAPATASDTAADTAAKNAAAAEKAAAASTTPIILPGAPGQSSKTLAASEAVKVANNSYSPDDVFFMQNMIPHHAQAVDMANLVEERTNQKDVVEIAGRIKASQADEIKFMEEWLEQRGEDITMEGHDHHGAHGGMAGMATPAQMEQLANSEGTDFDALFLTLMITHHEGAVTMVDDLTSQPGSAYDPVLYDFTNDIINDQKAEIEQMSAMLGSLSTDPRAGLSAGFTDAGEAMLHLKHVATLPKPAGFFDPQNPSGLPPIKEKKGDAKKDEAEADDDGQSTEDTQWGSRSPLLSFSNTDMAFQDDIMVAGSYHGFNIYKLQDDGTPKLYSSVVCPGGQGDVSVVGDLLIMSVEQTRGRVDCGLQGISEDVSKERFRGLRIFDISDLGQTRPSRAGADLPRLAHPFCCDRRRREAHRL